MRQSPYRISSLVLKVLTAVTALMFLSFFTIGYNRYYLEDTQFRAPLLTDVLLWFVGLLLAAAVAVTSWSVVVTLRRKGTYAAPQAGQVPLRPIHGGLVLFVVVAAAVTWLLGSSTPMAVNGETFTSAFWLRTADMFVGLCGLLAFAALAVVAFSSWLSLRKK